VKGARGQTTLVAIPFLRNLGGTSLRLMRASWRRVLASRAMDLKGNIIVVDR